MDDRFAYMLNSLWTKHYDLGRIVRFRHVTRGRQAAAYEVLTAESREFSAYLFPPVFDPGQLGVFAGAMAALAEQRFPVHVIYPSRTGTWTVVGPQGTYMMVGENPVGQYLLPDEWSAHDVSQLGLRLAWLHRLMGEHLALPEKGAGLGPAQELAGVLRGEQASVHPLPALDAGHLAALEGQLKSMGAPTWGVGWVHGDLQPAAVLLDEDRQIRSVVDWGLLHVGDPLEDLVDVFVHWCVGGDGMVRSELGRVLLESYRTLRPLPTQAQLWVELVARWCGRRIVDAGAGRRALPRGFADYLEDPAGLATALQLCEAK